MAAINVAMFRSLLIANRGEIACRVIRTARRMGLRTIAVYSDADANALHEKMADEAVHIGPAPARESYLRADAILAAARQTGAEAIHPGYGFLSENAEFAEACAAAGVIFVGPPASAIRAMGLKDRAKALMAKAGVAVVPGYLGDDQSAKHLASEAGKIGYRFLSRRWRAAAAKACAASMMRRISPPRWKARNAKASRRSATPAC
jgi:acetyl/propionyl-CoA carboxylase alpha subunit